MTRPTPDCLGIGRQCCVVVEPFETHTVHVRLMTFPLPSPGHMAKLPANPHSREPMQPLSCAHESVSPVTKLLAALCVFGVLAGCSDSGGSTPQGAGKPPAGAQAGGRQGGGPGGPGGFGGRASCRGRWV